MATKQTQLNQLLFQFYDKPVAKVSLELFFSIVMVTLFAVFAIRPTLVTMGNLLKEIQDKQNLDDQLGQKVAALSSVQATYLSLQDKLGVLDAALPSSPQVQDALLIIEKLASDRDITITQIQMTDIPKETPEGIDFSKATRLARPVSVSVVGDFPSIRQFIDDIRNVQRTMVVDSIIFTIDDSRGQKRLKAVITINLEYFGVDQNGKKTS